MKNLIIEIGDGVSINGTENAGVVTGILQEKGSTLVI